MTTQTPNTTKLPSRKSPLMIDAILEMKKNGGFLSFLESEWRKNGDLTHIQLGPRNMVLAVHPDAVKQIAIANRENYDKLDSYDIVRDYMTGNGILTSTGDPWRKQRKLMAPFFTPRAVEQFLPIMIEDAQSFVTRWDTKAATGETVEMVDEMMFVTASIILKSLFTTESGDKMIELKDDVETMIHFVMEMGQNPLHLPIWIKVGSNARYLDARQRVFAYITEVVSARRAIPQEQWPNDLLGRLMTARDEETGAPLSETLLRDESITMFFAGHETTARTLAFCWYALATHPDVLAKLQNEIDTVLGDRMPTVEDLKRLPYAYQVLKETMRVYPSIPIYPRDIVNDDVVDGKRLPAGMMALLSPYLTHRHPDFWPEPEKFDPDRWTPEREAAQHPFAYHPFAAGQRICLGNSFSLFESQVLLAIFARRFAPILATPGFVPQLDVVSTLISRNGLPMKIVSR
ncbi:MAG TPA: cytochrome P450 [Thermoflexales bacterium]|nr:cytochrome P450 [Thermoflexales bacterium]